MVRLFILIRRKGTKKFLGAIPARRGVTRKKLMNVARKQIKPGFSFSIITEAQLKKRFSNLISKRKIKRSRPKKRIRRKKVRRRIKK